MPVSILPCVLTLVLALPGPSGGRAPAAPRADSVVLEAGGRVTVLRRAD